MIFYFTATGNGKHIAEKIAKQTKDEIVNITDCIQDDKFSFSLSEGEKLGFIVPVYFFGLPMIIMEFLQKLKIDGKIEYSYAILNCGGNTGNADQMFMRTFAVDAIFGIKTVDNYVPMYPIESREVIERKLNQTEADVDVISRHINKGDIGRFNEARGSFISFLSPLVYSVYKNGRKTKKFTVNENCSSCGLCERICPRGVIRVEDKKPVWKIRQCELCFGCLHRCPTAAINYGKKSEINGRYINPRIHF